MEEFINSFGRNNLIIVIAIVFAIILSLVLIVLIEKIKLRKKLSGDFNEEEEVLEDKVDNIVYVEDKPKEKEEEVARQTLENITKKLVEQEQSNNLITKTTFEVEQEERSVISYDELIKASRDVDNTNDALLKDEGTEPITIEELYKKHLEENNISEKLDNPIFEETIEEPKKETFTEEPKKFKNSEIISPVFGIYNAKKSKQNDDYLEKTMDLEDLELEIKKTEEFLNELKELKEKLN